MKFQFSHNKLCRKMSQLTFEGDTDVITARQLEYITSILEKRGYKNGKVLVQPVGQPGDGFVANVKRFIVERDGETFKMVAKIAPTAEAQRSMMQTDKIFLNEHIMYTKVLPKFFELQKYAGVTENERLRYATCYGSLSEPINEIILLEDLQVPGFVMLDKMKSLSDASIKIVLKNFAILHSSSYALKKLEPEAYTALKNQLVDVWDLMQTLENITIYFEQLENDILTIVDDKYKKWFKGAIVSLPININKTVRTDKDSKYSVILQGDAWNNNIMFRLKNEIPVECCMIDYQGSRENNPAADIQYMIFNCTDYDTRAKHYHEWIDYYHSELGKCLAIYDLKVNYILPREQLDAALRRYGKMIFGISCMISSILIRESADAAKIREAVDKQGLDGLFSKVSLLDDKTVLRFKDRLEGLLNSFLELGFL